MTPFNKDNHIIAIQKLMEREQRGESINALRNHYIDANTINLDLDAPLYRIMQFERLCDVLSKRELSMVHPQRWDDPYEVFLMRSYGTTSEGEKVEFEPIKDSLYGLCFSLNPECDGLWRSFSNQSCTNCTQEKWSIRHGKQPITVKIKTTGRKLMDAFYDISVRFHSLSFWIGMVDYCNAEQMSNVINDGINHITDDTGVDQGE